MHRKDYAAQKADLGRLCVNNCPGKQSQRSRDVIISSLLFGNRRVITLAPRRVLARVAAPNAERSGVILRTSPPAPPAICCQWEDLCNGCSPHTRRRLVVCELFLHSEGCYLRKVSRTNQERPGNQNSVKQLRLLSVSLCRERLRKDSVPKMLKCNIRWDTKCSTILLPQPFSKPQNVISANYASQTSSRR